MYIAVSVRTRRQTERDTEGPAGQREIEMVKYVREERHCEYMGLKQAV